MTTSDVDCRQRKRVILTAESGYITSHEAIQRGVGTSACPWVLEAQPGQKLMLELLNFRGGKIQDHEASWKRTKIFYI